MGENAPKSYGMGLYKSIEIFFGWMAFLMSLTYFKFPVHLSLHSAPSHDKSVHGGDDNSGDVNSDIHASSGDVNGDIHDSSGDVTGDNYDSSGDANDDIEDDYEDGLKKCLITSICQYLSFPGI